MYIKKDCKMVYTKLGKNENAVQLSSIYSRNCSDKEYVIVSDEILQVLIDSNRYITRQERYIRENESAFPYDDSIGVKVPAMVEQYSFERDELERQQTAYYEELRLIFRQLTEKQRTRLYLHFKLNMTYRAIAKLEGTTSSAVQESCQSALEKLKNYHAILLKIARKSWIDLLKPTNLQENLKNRANKP